MNHDSVVTSRDEGRSQLHQSAKSHISHKIRRKGEKKRDAQNGHEIRTGENAQDEFPVDQVSPVFKDALVSSVNDVPLGFFAVFKSDCLFRFPYTRQCETHVGFTMLLDDVQLHERRTHPVGEPLEIRT